jgi:hypothetical protein
MMISDQKQPWKTGRRKGISRALALPAEALAKAGSRAHDLGELYWFPSLEGLGVGKSRVQGLRSKV